MSLPLVSPLFKNNNKISPPTLAIVEVLCILKCMVVKHVCTYEKIH